jgi:cytochrome c biogenesis protein
MKIIRRVLLSRSTALLLMAAVGFLGLVAVTIPQVLSPAPAEFTRWKQSAGVFGDVVEGLNLHRVYNSEIFFATVALSLIVLAYSLINLVSSVRRSGGMKSAGAVDTRRMNHLSFDVAGLHSVQAIVGKLERRGYVLCEESADRRLLRKNPVSRWGTVVLHVGLLVVIVAGVGTFLYEKRGFIQLLERDTFFGANPEFLSSESGVLGGEFTPPITISLQKFSPRYYANGEIRSLESIVAVGREGSDPAPAVLAINEPLSVDGVTIYQSTSFGYTVGLMLERNGRNVPAYFSLDQPLTPGQPYVGTSDFPTTDCLVTMRLTSDPANHSFDLLNPELDLVIVERGATVYSGRVRPGETIGFSGSRLTFSDVRHWSGLILTRDPFVPYAFAGFTLVLAGLVLVLVFPTRDIIVASQDLAGRVKISFIGMTRRDKTLYTDEFDELVRSLYLEEGIIDVGAPVAEI